VRKKYLQVSILAVHRKEQYLQGSNQAVPGKKTNIYKQGTSQF
jgi:hypothetical protein